MNRHNFGFGLHMCSVEVRTGRDRLQLFHTIGHVIPSALGARCTGSQPVTQMLFARGVRSFCTHLANKPSLVWQAQHDYLQGNYPVVREDAAQMCALQMQAEAGPTLLDQSEGLEPYLEKFIVRQVIFDKCLWGQVWVAC